MNWDASTASAGLTCALPTVVVALSGAGAGAGVAAVLSGGVVVPVVTGSVVVAGASALEPLPAALHSAERSASGTVPAGGQSALFCTSGTGAGAGAAGVDSWA